MTTLHCRCGIEVGIVRLNADTLALGHRVNPRNNRHAVRLARPAATSKGRARWDERQTEGPNVGREDGSSDGPSHLIATGTRPARKGSTRSRSAPSGISRPSGQGVASLIPPAIRPAPTAGDQGA